MKITVKGFITGLLSVATVAVFAQEPLDGAYVKTITKEKAPIPYDYIREADVFWAKRVWRKIDVSLKQNKPFTYPQKPLIEIIHSAAKGGDLTVYDPSVDNSDQFKAVLPVNKVANIGVSTDTAVTVDPVTMQEVTTIQKSEFSNDKVVGYRLKEDWLFDEETSSLIVRIIGLSPVMKYLDSQGNDLGETAMYWIYYPDLRSILAQHEVFNPKNDAQQMTWEDIFEARMFESYIYKVSNVYDRRIQEYSSGIDILIESDKIKNDLFVFEHDLWDF